MKTLALFFCVAVVAANANFLSEVLKHTKYNGKVSLDRSNGLSLKYNGALGFNNSIVAFNFADVGLKFNVSQNGSKDKSVHYGGDIVVNHLGHQAQGQVAGAAGFHAQWDHANSSDNSALFHFNHTVVNINNWTLSGGNYTVNGSHKGGINAFGTVGGENGKYRVQKDIQAGSFTNGDVYNGGAFVGNFTHVHFVRGNAHERITINKDNKTTNESQDGRNYSHHDPKANFFGVGRFKDFGAFGWKNNSWAVGRVGGGLFGGHVWAGNNTNKTENTTSWGVAVGKKAKFAYRAAVAKNHHVVGVGHAAGEAEILHALGAKHFSNGTTHVGVDHFGDVKKTFAGRPVAENQGFSDFAEHEAGELSVLDFQSFANLDEELTLIHLPEAERTNFKPQLGLNQTGKGIRGWVEAKWASGARIVAQPDSNSSATDLNIVGGSVYHLKGNDNVHHNWNFSGNHSGEAHLKVAGGGNNLSDISLELANSTQRLGQM